MSTKTDRRFSTRSPPQRRINASPVAPIGATGVKQRNNSRSFRMTSKQTLLLVQKCAHTFSFYDLASGKPEKHIVLPNFPHEFTVDPQRKLAYVGHYGI